MQAKILLSFSAFLIVSTVTSAQIKKGAVLLGGQIGFSTQTTQNVGLADGKYSSISVSPAFGKAIKENLVIGADINYFYSKNQSQYNDVQKQNGYGIGFFVRKYTALGKGFYLFAQSRLGAIYNTSSFSSVQQPTAANSGKGYTLQLAVYPGISYAVSRRLQLETGFNNLGYISFAHFRLTSPGSSQPYSVTDSFSLGSSLSNFSGLTIGFRVFLN